VAVITGAGRLSGIGFATARALAENGWPVLLSDLAFDERLLSGLPGGTDVATFEADVRDPGRVERLADFAVGRFGRIGAWVNNAGAVVGTGPITMVEDDDWETSMAVNAGGCFFGVRAALRHMLESGQADGRIVNVSSQAGKTAPPHFAAYAAAKAAVIALTQSVAAEVGDRGITVNSVCPGTVATPLLDEPAGVWETMAGLRGVTVERVRERAPRGIPLGRLIEPREVAAAIAFLCSDEAAAITGAALNVSGGEEVH
jgi:NAD(P)-dependent dehydrogenase (short-subunit alcohol dehydrogenase family)